MRNSHSQGSAVSLDPGQPVHSDTALTRSRRRLRSVTLAAVLLISTLGVAPQLVTTARFRGRIFSSVADIPPADTSVVFGAYVLADGTLSDAARERVEAGARLIQAGSATTLVISGDQRSNNQVTAMAAHAVASGAPPDAILVDALGIDTHDTCRHVAQITGEAVLVTQGYHLPRAMLMCHRDGLIPTGLAANRLDILETRGANSVAIAATRVLRFYREAFLTWAFLLGVYDNLSGEAEAIEATGGRQLAPYSGAGILASP